MNDQRFKFGFWVSVAWLFGAVVLLYLKKSDLAAMQPNAWGDFFAGCFICSRVRTFASVQMP